MFSPEERQRAVDLYFTTPMTTAQVVKHLGYPTRQCLERWLAKDPRCWPYGETHHPTGDEDQGRSSWCWAACGRSRPRRRVEELELGNAVMREVVEARRKRPGRRPAAPVGQGEDASGRPSAPDVFTQLDGMLARHRTERPPTATTPGSGLTDTPGCVFGWPGRSPLPRAGTGTAGSRPCSEPVSRRRCSAGSWPRMV